MPADYLQANKSIISDVKRNYKPYYKQELIPYQNQLLSAAYLALFLAALNHSLILRSLIT